jgi:hypothetical protein
MPRTEAILVCQRMQAQRMLAQLMLAAIARLAKS